MNASSLLRPKPDVRLDYQSDSQRRKHSAVYVPSSSQARSAKHSSKYPTSSAAAAAATRGYTSDSGHHSVSASAAPPPRAPQPYEPGHAAAPPSRHRTDPGTSYAHAQPAPSAHSAPGAYAHPSSFRGHAATAPQQYDPRAYAQRAPDRPPAPPQQHSRTHESSKSSRHRAYYDPASAPPSAVPATPQPHMAVPIPAESYKSAHRSRRHTTDDAPQRSTTQMTQAEANARAHADAAARARAADAERTRREAEEAERAREKAAAKARKRELRAQQEAALAAAAARQQQELQQAEAERARRKEQRRAERRRAEEERLRAEQERLRPQPTASRDAAQHPRVVSAKDPRTARIKDSDESDNSARKHAPAAKESRHHRYASAPAATTSVPAQAGSSPGQQSQQVPVVASSQASYLRQPAAYADNAPASSRETLRQYPAAAAPTRPKHTKGASWSHNDGASAPYPPGYAVVSGSDSETPARRPTRLRKRERPPPRAATDPFHAPAVQAVPMAQTASRSSGKGKTIGDMANWLFNRSDSKQGKKGPGTPSPPVDLPPNAVPAPALSRNDPSPVVSLRAGEGPPDPGYMRQRTNSNTGQPHPIDPRLMQAQTSQIPSHVESLMQAHSSQPSADTRQGYPVLTHQVASPPAAPHTVPQPPRPGVPNSAAPATRPSAYPASSFTASASHIATVAPSYSVPSPSPAPAPVPAAPPTPSSYYTAYGQQSSYSGHPPATATGHSRSASVPFDAPDRSQPTPVASSRYRHSPPRDNAASYAIPDSAGRYPVVNEMGQMQASSSQSRQVDPKVASAFPINEDSPGRSSQRQHTRKLSAGSLRPQTREEQRAAASSQQYPYAADSRTRTTKTSSPGQHNTSVPQSAAPPRSATHPVPSPRAAPPTVPSSSYAYDSSRPHASASQPSTYPDTIVYPPSASRVDTAPAPSSHPTVAHSSYNTSTATRATPGTSSRYQSAPAPQPQNTRSASQDTGSTTLVGHTPPQYASAVPATASSAALADPSGYSPGSRYPTAVPAPAPSASSARHYSSRHHADASPPGAHQPVTATKTPTQPTIAVPKPARSYSARGPAPIHIPARQFSSPGEDDELNTPSSLDAPGELYANALHTVSTTQSLPEGKKKAGFLGLFSRTRSGGKEQRILQPTHGGNVRQPASANPGAGAGTQGKASASKTSLTLGSDNEAKRRRTPAPTSAAPHAHPHAQTPQMAHGALPQFATVGRKDATMLRLLTYKHRFRTMSGASEEAIDGTNAGASTVRASPASSLRSSMVSPPFRDPVQATHEWRNQFEADEGVRGSTRRRRPGVTFDVYEDQPQAEDHRVPYVQRRRQPIPQQLVEQQ